MIQETDTTVPNQVRLGWQDTVEPPPPGMDSSEINNKLSIDRYNNGMICIRKPHARPTPGPPPHDEVPQNSTMDIDS